MQYDGSGADFGELPGVGRVNDAGNVAELSLLANADSQAILRELLQRVTVRRFDTTTTSLHEVFVRAVRQRAEQPAATESATGLPSRQPPAVEGEPSVEREGNVP